MATVDTLYVAWRSPSSRAYYPVGRLTEKPGSPRFEFTYIAGAKNAQKQGFQPFWGLPELDDVYLSDELFPLFSNRLMPGSRPDYSDHVARLGLDSSSATRFEVLSRSGGFRPTDTLEFFAPPVREAATDAFLWHFLVRGVRYMPMAEERTQRLQLGERLLPMQDRQNEFDQQAVLLRTQDNYLLGYVPMYFVSDMAQLLQCQPALQITVHKVNLPPAPIHNRILCVMQGPWPAGYKPFSAQMFLPLANAASHLNRPG